MLFDKYLDCLLAVESSLAHAVATVGVFSARRPVHTIVGFILLAGAFMTGFLQLEVKSSGTELWVDQNSAVFDNFVFVKETFEPLPRRNRVIITTTPEGDNVLNFNAVAEAFSFHEQVLNLRVSKDQVGIEQLCLKMSLESSSTSSCRFEGPLEQWGFNSTAFTSWFQPGDDVGQAFRTTYQDYKLHLGEVNVDAKSEAVSAKAMTLVYWLSGVHSAGTNALEWEKSFISLALEPRKYINVHVEADRSLDDELERSVGGDITLLVVAYVLMICFASLTMGKACSLTQGRSALAIAEVLLILFSAGAAYGLAGYIGIPFTSLAQVLPFILVGIGIDNAFVIIGAFDESDVTSDPFDRLYQAMRTSGMSITVTSLTDFSAFLLASFTALPAVQWFGQYACLAILFIWIAHLTLFPALLLLDSKRQADSRVDLFCCVRIASSKAAEGSSRPSALARFLENVYGPFILRPAVKMILLLFFFGVTGLGAWQATKITTDFNLREIAPDDSYLQSMYDVADKYYGDFSGNLPTALYLHGVDFSSPQVFQAMNCTKRRLLALQTIDADLGLTDWSSAFLAWAAATQPSNWSVTDFQGNFDATVREWFLTESSEPYRRDLVFDDSGELQAARIWAYHTVGSRSVDFVEQFESVERLAQDHQCGAIIDGHLFFSAGEAYLFYHQYSIIVGETISSILLSLLAVFVICTFLLVHPVSVLITVITVGMIFVVLLGSLPGVWDLSLNSVSMVNLIMAIGLVVDFTAHVVHTFGNQATDLSKDERVLRTLGSIGPAVLLGITTTFLGVLPLAWASSQIFRVFFKMFLSIVVVGGSFGMCFVPIVLSLIGPSLRFNSTKDLRHKAVGVKKSSCASNCSPSRSQRLDIQVS